MKLPHNIIIKNVAEIRGNFNFSILRKIQWWVDCNSILKKWREENCIYLIKKQEIESFSGKLELPLISANSQSVGYRYFVNPVAYRNKKWTIILLVWPGTTGWIKIFNSCKKKSGESRHDVDTLLKSRFAGFSDSQTITRFDKSRLGRLTQ